MTGGDGGGLGGSVNDVAIHLPAISLLDDARACVCVCVDLTRLLCMTFVMNRMKTTTMHTLLIRYER